MFYHIDLGKEKMLKPESEEYVHILSIQQHLNEIIDSTETSTKNNVKLSKNIVFEKIASNCLSLLGAMIDSLHFKYAPIIVHDLQELHNVISLIALQINQLYGPIEDEWIKETQNYQNDTFKDIDGDDNFVTLVFKEYDKAKENDNDNQEN